MQEYLLRFDLDEFSSNSTAWFQTTALRSTVADKYWNLNISAIIYFIILKQWKPIFILIFIYWYSFSLEIIVLRLITYNNNLSVVLAMILF